MQELLNQLQSPWWWAGAVITGVVGNLAWALLAWLYPRAVRNAVPVARGMVCAYAVATVVAVVYVAAVAPSDWNLLQQPHVTDWFSNRVMFPVVVSLSTVVCLTMVALFGPPSAQLVAATLFSCWAGFVAYSAATYQLSDPATVRLLVGAYVYSFFGSGLALLVMLPFLPWIVRRMDRQLGRA